MLSLSEIVTGKACVFAKHWSKRREWSRKYQCSSLITPGPSCGMSLNSISPDIDYISQTPLLWSLTVWLRFSQWDVRASGGSRDISLRDIMSGIFCSLLFHFPFFLPSSWNGDGLLLEHDRAHERDGKPAMLALDFYKREKGNAYLPKAAFIWDFCHPRQSTILIIIPQ